MEVSKNSKLEKAWEILNEYYPAWQSIFKEVWAKEVSANIVELVAIQKRNIWSIIVPHHNLMQIKYTIDLNELGVILDEENLDEKEWYDKNFVQIK